MKQCRLCRELKPSGDFYVFPRNRDGLKHDCKKCDNKLVVMRRKANPDHYREWGRLNARTIGRKAQITVWAQSETGKRSRKATLKKWASANHEKSLAHGRVKYALRVGKLQRKPCEVCGNTKVHAHHDDYAKQLDVRWLCAAHHHEHHIKMREFARAA